MVTDEEEAESGHNRNDDGHGHHEKNVSAYTLVLVHEGHFRGNFAGERLKGKFLMG